MSLGNNELFDDSYNYETHEIEKKKLRLGDLRNEQVLGVVKCMFLI